jgi:polyvinyl alcohol dehydrogenase (cytochrome)
MRVAAAMCLLIFGCGGTVTHADKTKRSDAGNSRDARVEPLADPNWTMLGYDLSSTHWNRGETKISRDTASRMKIAWVYDAGPGAMVTGTPVIADGTVYLVSNGLTALELATGALLWQTAGIQGTSSLALSDGVLYFYDESSIVHAFRAADGAELWQHSTTDIAGSSGLSSPVVTKEYVLVGSANSEETLRPPGGPQFRGYVDAIRKDGTIGWKKFTVEGPARGVSVWSTVSVDEALGLVYASTGNNHGPPATETSDAFLAMPLSGSSGFRWTQQSQFNDVWMLGGSGPDADFGANPVLFDVRGRKLVAGGNKGGDFWVLDRESGNVVKRINLGAGSAFVGGVFVAVAWDGARLLTVCNGATSTEPGSEPAPAGSTAVLYALDPLTLDTVWARQVAGSAYGRITVANGVGFFGKDATLQAFDTETGAVLAEFATEGTIATAPAISDGHVVFGSGLSYIGSTAGTKYYALVAR